MYGRTWSPSPDVASWTLSAYLEGVRVIPRRKAADVYNVTEAHRPLSEDVAYRQRRYLLSMGIRTACVLIAVLLAGHVPIWALLFPIIGAVVLPYVSVV